MFITFSGILSPIFITGNLLTFCVGRTLTTFLHFIHSIQPSVSSRYKPLFIQPHIGHLTSCLLKNNTFFLIIIFQQGQQHFHILSLERVLSCEINRISNILILTNPKINLNPKLNIVSGCNLFLEFTLTMSFHFLK